MKTKLALVVAALIPVAAVGAPGSSDTSKSQQQATSQAGSALKVEKQKLQKSVPATALLDEAVYAEDNTEVGNVSDVLVSKDGKVKNFIIETASNDRENSGMQGEQAEQKRVSDQNDWEQAENKAQRTADTAAKKTENALEGDRELKVNPQDVKYDEKQGRVTIAKQKLKQAEGQVFEQRSQDELQLSDIVGMEVNLQDDDSFGRVEDVMLSKDNTEVVALVVDNWDGLEKHRRALPMKQAEIDAENEEINFKASESDVQGLPDFNLANYEEDSGWDLTDWTQ